MKTIHVFRLQLAVFCVFAMQACQDSTHSVNNDIVEKVEKIQIDSFLRHVVIFKFNEDSSEEDVKAINDSFLALGDSISVVKDFEWGLNHSPEGLDQDFTHCYMLTFNSEEDRDSIYAPHPLHQAFVASLQPHLEKVFVVDYWVN